MWTVILTASVKCRCCCDHCHQRHHHPHRHHHNHNQHHHHHHHQHHCAVMKFSCFMLCCGLICPAVSSLKPLTSDRYIEYIEYIERERERQRGRERERECVCVCARVRVCVRVFVRASVCVCVRACARVGVICPTVAAFPINWDAHQNPFSTHNAYLFLRHLSCRNIKSWSHTFKKI